MSGEQPKSSKKSKASKTGIKQKVQAFTSKQKATLTRISSKARNQLSAFILIKLFTKKCM